MSERKPVLKNADVSGDMQQAAVGCSAQALEQCDIEKENAAFNKRERERDYFDRVNWR
ncbi:unnamed protein product [Lymnaea stagnalis]|uniref:Uncharacterized protein n=1 Tax=Lymnaea stagnalis TaxID=6523 RepID=A0AAV2HR24_LYMST